jgi:phenylacetate-CoA ligase
MNPFATYFTYRKLLRSQWLDRDSLRRLQEEKLRRLVVHAYRTVPYYRKRFDESGIVPEEIRSLGDLARVPITPKSDLQAADLETITSSIYSNHRLVVDRSSGSTGYPFTVYFDHQFVRMRDALFLRALTTAGYRVGRRLALITRPREKVSRRWLRWYFISNQDPPERMLAELDRIRPGTLYGCMTPLRQLALYVRETGATVHRPQLLISTAEALDEGTRRLLEETFGAEVYDIYGLTEMGIVGWQCSERNGYHVAEDTVIVEFVPSARGEDLHLVMTNLELKATPLIRFQTGDIGVPGAATPCACGRAMVRLKRMEGRIVDCVQLRDGHTISPYRFTAIFKKLPGIKRYQVIQQDYDVFTVRLIVAQGAGEQGTAEAVQRAIRSIVGHNAQVHSQIESSLDPPPGEKFRVVKCRLATRGLNENSECLL